MEPSAAAAALAAADASHVAEEYVAALVDACAMARGTLKLGLQVLGVRVLKIPHLDGGATDRVAPSTSVPYSNVR
jgi:hypothetical protein